MIFKRVSNLSRSLYRNFANLWTQNIYYVTDKANWSFYWDAYYITEGLRKNCRRHSYMIHNPWRLKNQIIHFGDRYAYLNGPFSKLHSSNDVFLTWFHGNPADSNPDMQRLFALLPEATKYLKKIVVSCGISKGVLVEIGILEEKLVTIPLGVDMMQFYPPSVELKMKIRAKLGIPKDVICIGSFQKDGAGWGDGLDPKLVKGPDVFLEVIANLSKHYNNLLVLLTGPARGYVKEGLKKLRVPYIHHFLDNFHDIIRYYQALDLYIITSRCEGGPKALLESWATGVPIISTRVGMPADLIQHGNNGLLAEVEDVETLSNHATTLLEDATLRVRCISQALEDVKPYDWQLIAEEYYKKLYQPIMR